MPLPPPPISAQAKRSDWMQNNKKWFIPTLIVGCVAAFALFITGIFLIVAVSMKSSGAYKQAMEMVSNDPQVIEALGTPLEAGTFLLGSIRTRGGAGTADMKIPVSGPYGEGRMRVKANRWDKKWTIYYLEVSVASTGEKYILVE